MMVSINFLLWLFGFLPVLLFCVSGALAMQTDASESGLALIASSPFRMLLRPTPSELHLEAMQVLEEAATAAIMEGLDEPHVDVEVVIQQSEFVELGVDRNELPTTRVRFFALATIEQEGKSTPKKEAQETLDSSIELLFGSPDVQERFLDYLRAYPLLRDVNQVVVRAVVPSSPPADAATSAVKSGKKLTTVDIILIVVSSAIFLGILWMVIQHHKDRGYLENLRLHTFNATPVQRAEPRYEQDDDSEDLKTPTGTPEKGTLEDIAEEEEEPYTPSTPSTTNSVTDADLNLEGSPPRPVRITVTVSPPRSEPTVSAASIQPDGPRLQEAFDNNWFHQSQSSDRMFEYRDHGYCQDDEGYDGQISSGESSEDIFHIDVDALCSSVGSVEDTRSKTTSSTSATAISEWMKSIRVVPSKSDLKTSGTGSTGSRGRSTEPSLDHQSTLEQSSLEQLSLEQSMASSSVGTEPGKFRQLEV